jgi:hypothetical protein
MSRVTEPALLLLRDGQHLRCDDTRPAWLSVVSGRIWLTRAGDPDDHFLHAGQAMRLEAGARALFSAEGGPAEVAVLQEQPGRTMQDLQPSLCTDP